MQGLAILPIPAINPLQSLLIGRILASGLSKKRNEHPSTYYGSNRPTAGGAQSSPMGGLMRRLSVTSASMAIALAAAVSGHAAGSTAPIAAEASVQPVVGVCDGAAPCHRHSVP